MNIDKIGLFIQNKREEKNLTRIELAKKLNIASVHIKKLETGKKLPDILIIEKICKILDISIAEFFKGTKLDEKQTKENNELLLETIKIVDNNSNKKYINIINKFLIVTFLFVAIVFGYLNCKMMYYQNKYYYSNEHKEEYSKKVEEIKANFDLIESNKTKFNEEFYNNIVLLKEKYSLLLNDKKVTSILSDKEKYKLKDLKTLMDLYLFHNSILNSSEYEEVEKNIYKSMIKSDSNYVDNLLKFNTYIYMEKQQYSSATDSLYYSKETYSKIDTYVAAKIEYLYFFRLTAIDALLDDIIKVGELDEQ